jgi:hypothetical protein
MCNRLLIVAFLTRYSVAICMAKYLLENRRDVRVHDDELVPLYILLKWEIKGRDMVTGVH